MKISVILLLDVIFIILLTYSVESVFADHLLSDKGIFKDQNSFNLTPTSNSKYQIHLQVEVRNVYGDLISVSETKHGKYLSHELTDNTFDEKLGEKEIIITDGIKYEKIQYTNTLYTKQLIDNSNSPHFIGLWRIEKCGEIDGHGFNCVPIFQTSTAHMSITEGDVVTNQWTVLRINQ